MSKSPSCERCLIYALGGGLGHLNRAVAFARAAIRRYGSAGTASRPTLEICLVTNSPYANVLPIADELGPGHQIIQLSPTLSRDQTATRIRSLLETTSFDTLFVDTFPRGLGGELADVIPQLRCRRVLIHRNLNARYVAEYDVAKAVDNFDLLLVPGEAAPFDQHPRAHVTAPWVIRDQTELLSRDAARQLLNASTNSLPIVAVVGCGKIDEVEEMRQIAGRLAKTFQSHANIRFGTPRLISTAQADLDRASVERPADETPTLLPADDVLKVAPNTIHLWPLFQAMRGVDVVVGSGGYNTVHEARITRRPLIALPRARRYDRQDVRLSDNETATNVESIEQKLTAALSLISDSRQPDIPDFQNGVHQALDALDGSS